MPNLANSGYQGRGEPLRRGVPIRLITEAESTLLVNQLLEKMLARRKCFLAKGRGGGMTPAATYTKID